MASATFFGVDTTTKGNWIGVYGALGYYYRDNSGILTDLPANSIAFDANALQGTFAWANTSSDARALLRLDEDPDNRFFGGWFDNDTGHIDFDVPAGTRLWIYCVDGDSNTRRQTIRIRDRSNNNLATHALNATFNGGVWVGFDVEGEIRVHFTKDAGANVVVSGFFFDVAAAAEAPDPPAIEAPEDSDTIGLSFDLTVEDVSGTGSGTTLEYKVEYETSVGAGWQTLIDWTTDRPNALSVSSLPLAEGSGRRLRALARWNDAESDPGDIVTVTVSWGTSFQEYLEDLTPDVLWMLDETSGSTATDSSGNGRDGTYDSQVLGEPSIIPALPNSSAALNAGGNNKWVSRSDEAWMSPGAGSFTAIISVKPSSLAAQRDIIGKVDEWQIWLETTGRIQAWIAPAWTNFLSSDDAAGKLVADTPALIGIRRDVAVGKASLWINGVKVGEANHSATIPNSALPLRVFGSSAGSNRSFPGLGQAFAYWASTALTDDEMVILAGLWAAAPSVEPPVAPTITQPTEGEIHDRGKLRVTLSDVSATGQNGLLEYMVEIEHSIGAGWSTLIDWTNDRPVGTEIDISELADGDDYRLRAFARRAVDKVSDASAVRTFEVAFDDAGPATPAIDVVFIGIGAVGVLLSPFQSTAAGAVAAKSHFQLARDEDPTFSSPVYEREGPGTTIITGSNLITTPGTIPGGTRFCLLRGGEGSSGSAIYPTSDKDPVDVWVRGRYEDDLEQLSEWSLPVRARLLRLSDVIAPAQYYASADLSGNGRIPTLRQYSDQPGLGPGGARGGASSLNFPVGLAEPDWPLGTDDLGTRGVTGFAGAANAIQWFVGADDALAMSVERADEQAVLPDFGFFIRFVPHYFQTGTVGERLMSMGAGATSTEANTPSLLEVGFNRDDDAWLRFTGLVDGPTTEETGLPEGLFRLHEMLTLRISHKYYDDGDDQVSILRCNGEIIYEGAPLVIDDSAEFPITTLGRFCLGLAGWDGHAGSPKGHHGVFTEAALWWNEDLDYEDADDLPAVESVDLDSQSAVIASAPALYWPLELTLRPNTPTLAVEE